MLRNRLRWITLRQPHLYALTVALAFTAALVVVTQGEPDVVESVEARAQVLAQATRATSTTTTVFAFPDEAVEVPGLLDVELELIDEVAAVAATTTTTTTPAPAPNQASPAPKPSTTTSTTAPPAPTPKLSPGFRADYEAEFASRINSLRATNGLTTLTRNGSLNSRARDWAKALAAKGSLQHSNLANLVPPWAIAGENVGKGGSVSVIFGLLKDSSGHLSNMVGTAFTDIGIGVWVDGAGTLWTVHVFAG